MVFRRFTGVASSARLIERLTILIPTMNRPGFLSRILSYYHGLKCTIIVADSSDLRHPSVEKDHPQVQYLLYERASFKHKILDAASRIITPYFLICGDDDFVLIDAIKRGLDFLEKNPQFAAVQGQQGNFYFEPGEFRKVVFSVRYPLQQSSVEGQKRSFRQVESPMALEAKQLSLFGN